MKTVYQRISALLVAGALTACASVDHAGAYAPGCMAMAGDTIELDGERFVWDKFTDEVRFNPDGKVDDAFPAHPISGYYEVDHDKLILKPDSNGVTSVFYLVNDSGHNYVLNVMQHSEWRATGAMPKCALTQARMGEG